MLKFIGLLLVIPSALVRAWAIQLMWLWFIVPVTGLRPISKAAAYGLAIFLTVLSLDVGDLQAVEKSNENPKNVIIYPLTSMVILYICVGIGWVMKTYLL